MFTDPLNIAMLAVLAVLIFFMFRNSRKRKADAAKLAEQIVPGVEVMTNFGLFGTLLSIDEGSKVAEIETTPGTIIRVHRQTVTRVVTQDELSADVPTSVEDAMARANAEEAAREAAAAEASQTEPEFGERSPVVAVVETDGVAEDPIDKKTRRPSKKTAE
jgi:preprotein translocase subunit YajC